MEEQFLDFLSDDLVKFCSYGTHEHNNYYSACSAVVIQELDTLANLSSKEFEEYFGEQGGDYSSTNNETTSVKEMERKDYFKKGIN